MSQTHPRGIALVTGAAKRIGREIALALADDGWDIAVHFSRSRVEAEALCADISARGRRAALYSADLANAAETAALIPQVTATLGPPLLLVNNASMFVEDAAEALSPALWDAQMAINLRAPVFLATDLAKTLPAGAVGHVVNLVDQRVWRTTPEFFSYTLSKAALFDATRMLAQALAPRVRVNAIGPGPILQSIHQSPQEFADEARSTLLGRGATPAEIAQAIRFILDAPAMTGQMIALDGGQHLQWR